MQFLGVDRIGPRLGAHPRDRLRIEPAEVRRALRCKPAPRHHRLRPPLLQRCIVEIRIGPRRQHLQRQRRRLRQVTGNDADIAGLDACKQPLQPFDVHRLVQAVRDRLIGQRMIGNLAIAGQVLGAGHLVGEHAGDQILRLHARELRRHLPAAAESRQRQRDARHPAPPRGEHRRIEHRLDQQRSHAVGAQILRHLRKFETVRGGQRQHDVVLGRRRLQFEVEPAAKALAQREAPGAVDPAAERRMDRQAACRRLRRRSAPARWCRASAGIPARRTTPSDTRATAPLPPRRCRSLRSANVARWRRTHRAAAG